MSIKKDLNILEKLKRLNKQEREEILAWLDSKIEENEKKKV